jgi:hypothetical protein
MCQQFMFQTSIKATSLVWQNIQLWQYKIIMFIQTVLGSVVTQKTIKTHKNQHTIKHSRVVVATKWKWAAHSLAK